MTEVIFVPRPAILIRRLHKKGWREAREAFLERLGEAFEDRAFRKSARDARFSILAGRASVVLYKDSEFGLCDIVFCRRDGKIVVYIARPTRQF